MGDQIIDLQDWLETPTGQYVQAWESAQYDRAVADVFGFNALQLGLPGLDTLRSNRMPHRWLASTAVDRPDGPKTSLVSDFSALPFPAASLDLVVLPHTLELSDDPHGTLREVERVLVADGRLVICGFNPAGMWGLRQRRERWTRRLAWGDQVAPDIGAWIGYWRLRDWLRLLSFELEHSQFGCYRPAVRTQTWLDRWAWTDRLGPSWWPVLGSVYCVVAVKRVRGMRLLGPAWKASAKVVRAPVPIANQVGERSPEH